MPQDDMQSYIQKSFEPILKRENELGAKEYKVRLMLLIHAEMLRTNDVNIGIGRLIDLIDQATDK